MARYLNREFLHYCQANQLEKVSACLTLEVDVNTVSEDGLWSGLTIAAHMNNKKLLDILLSHPHIEINKTTDADVVKLTILNKNIDIYIFSINIPNVFENGFSILTMK